MSWRATHINSMPVHFLRLVLQGAQHSAQIFSLSMLLSSIFIYNQVGAIDAIAIERLAMVCELAKRIKDRSTTGVLTREMALHPVSLQSRISLCMQSLVADAAACAQ